MQALPAPPVPASLPEDADGQSDAETADARQERDDGDEAKLAARTEEHAATVAADTIADDNAAADRSAAEDAVKHPAVAAELSDDYDSEAAQDVGSDVGGDNCSMDYAGDGESDDDEATLEEEEVHAWSMLSRTQIDRLLPQSISLDGH